MDWENYALRPVVGRTFAKGHGLAGLRIGALVTIWELETSELLTGPYAMLAEAARGVATPELRNQGTLGGNLCRCTGYQNIVKAVRLAATRLSAK